MNQWSMTTHSYNCITMLTFSTTALPFLWFFSTKPSLNQKHKTYGVLNEFKMHLSVLVQEQNLLFLWTLYHYHCSKCVKDFLLLFFKVNLYLSVLGNNGGRNQADVSISFLILLALLITSQLNLVWRNL